MEESDRYRNTFELTSIIEPPPFEPSFILEPISITELNRSPGMRQTKREFNAISEEKQRGEKIKFPPQPLFYPGVDKAVRSILNARSKSNKPETRRPVKPLKRFCDQSASSTIASSQSNPTDLHCSDTDHSPLAWSHSHEQLPFCSPQPQQLRAPSPERSSTIPRRKDVQFSTPHQSNEKYGSDSQINIPQSSYRTNKSRRMYITSYIQSNYISLVAPYPSRSVPNRRQQNFGFGTYTYNVNKMYYIGILIQPQVYILHIHVEKLYPVQVVINVPHCSIPNLWIHVGAPFISKVIMLLMNV